MFSPRRILVALVAVVAAVSLLAACGGGDDNGGGGGTDNTSGLAPAEILARSADAARALESFRLAFEVTGTADLGSATDSLLGSDIDISGEGPVHPPDAASIDAKITLSGLPVQVNLTRVGDQVVLGALGSNIGLKLSPEQLAPIDFSAVYPELASWIVDPKEDDRTSVDGVPTVAITGSVDAGAALATLAPLLGAAAPEAGAADGVAGIATVWVGTDDFVPRRIRLTLAGDAAGLAPGAGTIDLAIHADVSDINTAADVVLPPIDDTMSIDQLGGLIGG